MEITLIDKMGTDLTVVNSARVSFSKESFLVDSEELNGEVDEAWFSMTGQHVYKQVLSEADQKLIKYLAKNNHWTPFSHVQITMREKVPIFVARQRFKHMVGFTYNEVSRRYVDDTPEFFVPDIWRKRAENKKQGSSDEEVVNLSYGMEDDGYGNTEILIPIKEDYRYFIEYVGTLYKTMIDNGVAPEQARMILPQSMYTEFYSTGSLAAWARAYKLRSDPHAQKEIQDLAKMWNDVISNIEGLKHSWEALVGEEK